MRILFLGTPEFAIPSLDALLAAGHQIVGVITQPDKPTGRRREITAPPVKQRALERGIPVYQPARMRDPGFLAQMRELAPDLVAYAAFGRILPRAFLEIPTLGCLNVHASLLPSYRGAAPIQWALMNGEPVTGVSVMQADVGLDTGPVAASQSVSIGPDEDAGSLMERLAVVGADLLVEVVADVAMGRARFTPQDESRASYAPPLSTEDAQIDWNRPAIRIHNQVRAMSPQVGAVTFMRGKPVKVWRSEPADLPADRGAGAIVQIEKQAIIVATGEGSLRLLEVQPAGGRRMDAASFARGQRLAVGDQLGS